MASKISDLKNSLSRLTERVDVYTKGGRMVPLPDRSVIEKKIDPKGKGAERGKENLPALGIDGPDECELEIITAYEELLTDTAERVSESAATYNSRISSIDLTAYMDDLTDGCRAALEAFNKQVVADVGMLKHRYEEVRDKASDFQLFKSERNIARSPDLPSSSRRQVGWAIIAILFLIESVGNSGFLSVGNRGGILGAYVEAVSFSFVNIGLALITGHFLIRMKNSHEKQQRYLGLGLSGLSLCLAFLLSLSLAHYREVASLGVLGEGGGGLAIQNLVANPFGLTEIQSWLLFLMGLLFWVIAVIDIYGLDDPIPGYGRVARNKKKSLEDYERYKEVMIEELDELRTDEEDTIKDTRRQLVDLQSHLGSLIESRKALFNQWDEFSTQATKQAVELVNIYRTANKQERKSAPKSFKNSLTPEIPSLTSFETPIDQEKLANQVDLGRERLKDTQDKFYAEFNRALAIFSEIETETAA